LSPLWTHGEPRARAPRTIPVDAYAAIVNGRVILVSDVMMAVRPIEEQLRASFYSPDELRARLREAYDEALQELVARALIVEEFDSRGGALPDRVINDHLGEVVRERFNNDHVELLQALTAQQLTFEEWRAQIRDQLIVSILRRQEVIDRISISPTDIERRYQERLDEFRIPEQVKLRMISLNRGETEQEHETKRRQANELRERLVFGENFAALARQYGEGSRAGRGGDWGWMAPGDLRPELAAVARQLEPGRISDVIETEDQYYLLLVEARRAAGATPLEEVSASLRDDLWREAYEQLNRTWIGHLRQKHFVKTF
jgi:peptidyl-prolyl cis-trans isomerase SurA